jgi:hypothetical protein
MEEEGKIVVWITMGYAKKPFIQELSSGKGRY